LYINGYEYFAPLSSFKPKHSSMKESLDFLKIKKYAVIISIICFLFHRIYVHLLTSMHSGIRNIRLCCLQNIVL
ncbi:MAG: type III toxin-antitoxin system ToxN/AbiQ family toxin, partial [Oscillospiraceae bacterium]|nr:type III toxin-antitoxin system ToxN/AbiQ family toxin [Oscillospiraceae bacterium]